MKLSLPTIGGIMSRRLLINFRTRADVLAAVLPFPFRQKTIDGCGVAGICLIRLEQMRPAHFPAIVGISSENAAHRIAVEWDDEHGTHEGVFIPQRHTNSRLNQLAGGRLFPGIHQRADFQCWLTDRRYKIEVTSPTGARIVRVAARLGDNWNAGSIFPSLNSASGFFRRGSCGWSPDGRGALEGLELRTNDWHVEPLVVERVESNYFDDRNLFPAGTIEFDCALLMRGIEHHWHALPPLNQPMEVL